MPFEIAQKFLDKLFEQDKVYWSNYFLKSVFEYKYVILDFFGGEVSLFPQLIEQIVQYFLQKAAKYYPSWTKSYAIRLNTNLTTYFRGSPFRDFCLRYLPHIQMLGTLDGCKSFHDKTRLYPSGKGSFDDALRGWKTWAEDRGEKISSRLTVSPENMEYLMDSFHYFVDELGLKEFRFYFTSEDTWKDKDKLRFKEILKQLADEAIEKYPDVYIWFFDTVYDRNVRFANCGINGSVICLNWNGLIYNCFRFAEDSNALNRETYYLGDVDNGITRQDRLDYYRNFMSKWEDKCKKCPIHNCDPCPAFAYEYTGDLAKHPHYSCDLNRIGFDMGYYYFRRRIEWLMKNIENHSLKQEDLIYEKDREVIRYFTEDENGRDSKDKNS